MGEDIKTYGECLERLYKTHSVKLGLESTKLLSESFGNPYNDYKTIHVAGTNGKGSVCYKIYISLKLRKYKVGIFTSPHIFSLRERIVVNDNPISEKDLICLVNKVLRKSKKLNLSPTFFEIITIVAFLHFFNEKVDYAVIETGIGGRLDATNILNKPELVIITSIGYDHEYLLGYKLKNICNEKIGIFKENAKVLIGPSVSIYKNVFEKAKELTCTIQAVSPEPRGETYNEENTRIATEALKMLNINIDTFLKSIITIKPPLRVQYLAKEQIQHVKKKYTNINNEQLDVFPPYPHAVILDVGHNGTAIDRLCRDINYFHRDISIRVCISLTKPRSVNIFQPLIAQFPGVLKHVFSPLLPPPQQDIFYLPSVNMRTYDFDEVVDMMDNDDRVSSELKGHILSSAEKVNQWLLHEMGEKMDCRKDAHKLHARRDFYERAISNLKLAKKCSGEFGKKKKKKKEASP
ncbi:dihydrofolate synthase/folylpolyglutamate synthase, putative (DHFS-FPGS) [Plasmodium ovale wallikeri]|uniref:Dihydrofolate synthase/folylpolyglutamate synthase, putative (DHFS-FPGS) n=1 Tax=Plasmodium ovale wallikeri TaxID=864142 RepID=A0A1A8ZBX4_PLAOA|nr:dihydrofolate synthase/folylpolyglutamate synthase, putative (DHFS-FPGS) [Plasmodium ovale wallikeri]